MQLHSFEEFCKVVKPNPGVDCFLQWLIQSIPPIQWIQPNKLHQTGRPDQPPLLFQANS